MTTVGRPRAGRHRADRRVADGVANDGESDVGAHYSREERRESSYGDAGNAIAVDRPRPRRDGRGQPPRARPDQEYRPQGGGYRPAPEARPEERHRPRERYGAGTDYRPGPEARPPYQPSREPRPPDEQNALREGYRPGDGAALRRAVPPDERLGRADRYPVGDGPRPSREMPPNSGYRHSEAQRPTGAYLPGGRVAPNERDQPRDAYRRPGPEAGPDGYQRARTARTAEAYRPAPQLLREPAHRETRRDGRPTQSPVERGYRQAEPIQRHPEPALRPPRSRLLARAGHLVAVLVGALLLAAIVALGLGAHVTHAPAGGPRIAFGWPGMRYLIYAVWMVPVVELVLLFVGQFNNRFRFRRAAPGTFAGMIIQITTTGREQERVNEIISQIRGYRLVMKHQIWVVTEPGQHDHYPAADQVIIVPADFVARSERKARALEYSRRVRVSRGLNRPNIKILFNDDDVAPTKAYIERAFEADYDICEGVTSPRTEYAVRPLGHFLASHADDMRTHACLVYCSVFQGILGRPLHVHGEGLTVTGAAENIVTWNWPAFASEDLVFGQRAARAGLRWGWFHEYVELTSPWTLRDFITQRRRWLWGDIHGIRHRDVLSLRGALLVAGKYLFGLVTLAFSVAGLVLRLTGQLPGQSSIYNAAKLSIVAWLVVFFACGWIGASSRVSHRTNDSKLLQASTAVLMLPVSSFLTLAGVLIPLVQGNPRTFQVIRKTRGPAR
jgi:hypothetical protein